MENCSSLNGRAQHEPREQEVRTAGGVIAGRVLAVPDDKQKQT